MSKLNSIEIKYLTGVGPKRAEVLNKQLDIYNYHDLLHYYPQKYIDRSKIYKISELAGDLNYVQLKGRFIIFNTLGEGAKTRLQALFSDGTGTMEVVWFQRIKHIKETYVTGKEYILFGRPTLFNGKYNLAHPEIEVYSETNQPCGIRGIYSLTETARKRGITSNTIYTLVKNLFSKVNYIGETLPQSVIKSHNLMPLKEALMNVHMPESMVKMEEARRRLKFEELFYVQMNIFKYTQQRNSQVKGNIFGRIGEKFNDFFFNVLPFPLTNAQKRVLREIRTDVGSGRQMNRLLQGDVGSGKTIVAMMSALMAVDNGFQACIMAPTEILATQHYESLSEFGEKIGVRIELLTGSTKEAKRKVIHAGLMSGEVNILIGTHAVIEDTVNFAHLGLVIIDEQHRFGVAQRAKLWKKSLVPPHILVMTATPIPRTLAMTIYGDLEVSVIDELPPGRKPVATSLLFENNRNRINEAIRSQLNEGRQIYIVYPLIQESEKSDLKSLEEGYKQTVQTFKEYKVGFVHGKMKPAEKDEQMQKFASNETQILVATTVIEVGVNVPNATVMVIENAERFGLSQLHQLRGRVGRGADKSYCILVSKYEIANDTRKRLEIMTHTTDGFKIAEADMQMRGPGDIEGTQQSGIAFNLKIANLASDGLLISVTREAAKEVIEDDPNFTKPENKIVELQLQERFSKSIDWSRIS